MIMHQGYAKVTHPENALSYRTTISPVGANSPKKYKALSQSMLDDFMRLRENAQRVLWDAEPTRKATPSKVDRQPPRAPFNPRHNSSSSDSESSSGYSSSTSTTSKSFTASSAPSHGSSVETSRPSHARAFDFARRLRNTSAVNTPDELSDFEDIDLQLRVPKSNATPWKRHSDGSGNASSLRGPTHVPSPRGGHIGLNETHKRVDASPLSLGRIQRHHRQREWLLSPRKDDEVVVGHVGIGIGKGTLTSVITGTLSKGLAARHVDVMAGDLISVTSRVDPRASTSVWPNSRNAESPSTQPRIVLIDEPATLSRTSGNTAVATSSIRAGTAAGDISDSDSATKVTPRYGSAIALPNAVVRSTLHTTLKDHHQHNHTIISRITGTGLTLISPPWSDNNRSVGINTCTTSSRPQSNSSSSSPSEPAEKGSGPYLGGSTSAVGVPQPHGAVDTKPSIGTTLTTQILGKAQQTLASIEAKQLLEQLTELLRTTQTRQEEERRALNAARHLTQGEQRLSSYAWSTPAVTLLREQQKELATITKQIAEVKRVLVEVDRHAVEVKQTMLDASVISASSLGTQPSRGRRAKREKRDSEAADTLRQAEEERKRARERQNKHARKVVFAKRVAEAKRVKWEARRDAALAEAEQISARLKEGQRRAYLERMSQKVKNQEAKTSNRPMRPASDATTKYVDVESDTEEEGSSSSQILSDVDNGAGEMLNDPNIDVAIIFSRIFSERVEDVSTPDLLSEFSHCASSSSPSHLSREGSSAPSRSPSEERVGWRKLEENGTSRVAREDANASRWLHEPQLYPSSFINRLLKGKKEPTPPLSLPDEQPTRADDERAPTQSDGLLITPLRVSNSPGPKRPSAVGREASPCESPPHPPRVEEAKTLVASSNSTIAVPSSKIYVTSTEESFIEKREGTSQASTTVVTWHYRLQRDGGKEPRNPNHDVILQDDEGEELLRQGAYEFVGPNEEEEDHQSSLLVIRESLSGRNSQPSFPRKIVQSEQTRERSPFLAQKDSALGLDKVLLAASQISLLREDPIRFRGDSTPLSEAWLCVTQRRHESTEVPVNVEGEEVRVCDDEWEQEIYPPPQDQLVEAQPLLLVSSGQQTLEPLPSEFQTRDKTVQTVCDAASSPMSPSVKPDEHQGAVTPSTSLLTVSRPPLAASSPSVSVPLKQASRVRSPSRSLSAQSRARSMSFNKDHSKRIEGDLVCERCYKHGKGAGGCPPTKGSSRLALARNSFHFRDGAYQTPAGKEAREKRRRSQSAQQVEPNNMARPEEGEFVIPALSEIRSIATEEDGLAETVRALQKEGKVAVITRCGSVSSCVTPPREPEKRHESRITSTTLTTPTFASMAQCSPRGLAMLAVGDHHTEVGGRNASPSRVTLFVRDTLTSATDSSLHPLRNSPSRNQNWNNGQPWSPIRSASARNIGPPSSDRARRLLSTPPRARDDIATESDEDNEVRSRTKIPLPTPRMRVRSVGRRGGLTSLTSPSKLVTRAARAHSLSPRTTFERATAGELKGIRERSAERVKTALSIKRESNDAQPSRASALVFTSLRDDDGSDFFDSVSELTVSARTSRGASVQPLSDLPLPKLPIDLLNAVCEF